MKKLATLLNICLRKNLHFVAYSLPNSNYFEVIIEHHLLCSNVKSGFVFHPFEVSPEHPEIFIHADFKTNTGVIDDDFIRAIEKLPAIPKSKKSSTITAISKQDYLKQVNSGIAKLKTQKIKKFIFSRVKTIENTTSLDLSNYLFRLHKKHTSAFIYLLNHEKSGTWLGATPEALLKWEEQQISTMALAGTLPNQGQKPNWGTKELQEQAYVTRYIENTFSTHNIQYKKSETKTVIAGPVFHLQTQIESTQDVLFKQAKNLLKDLHPTPAICGVPLAKAKETIYEIENYDRAYYTGYLGLVSPEKELNLFVNLRCMQIFSNKLALYLGGGITANSIAEKEWDETNFKAKTLLSELEKLSFTKI